LLGTLRLLVNLPTSALFALGRGLGILSYYALPKRREIGEINLRIAFPQATPQEIQHLLKCSMKNTGVALFETVLSWWKSERVLALCKTEGLDNLRKAQESGKGIVILSAHFTCVEIGGQLINKHAPVYVMYKRVKNRLFNHFVEYHRRRLYTSLVDHRKPANMLRGLKKGFAAWYLPDQSVNSKDNIFAPFFGVTTATLTTTARIAKITGAHVVPYSIMRNEKNNTYTLKFFPMLENFPGGDIEQDTIRINKVLEELIKENPEQYLWVHKRYKNRPAGEADIYPPKIRKKRKK